MDWLDAIRSFGGGGSQRTSVSSVATNTASVNPVIINSTGAGPVTGSTSATQTASPSAPSNASGGDSWGLPTPAGSLMSGGANPVGRASIYQAPSPANAPGQAATAAQTDDGAIYLLGLGAAALMLMQD